MNIKKIVTIIVCVFIVLSLILTFLAITQKKEIAHNSTSQTTPSLSKNTTNKTISEWTSYPTKQFTVNVPKNWQVKTQPVVNGGSLTTIKPSATQNTLAQLTIETDPFSQNLQEQKESIISALGLKESTITIGQYTGEKFNGTMPARFLGYSTNEQFQDTSIIYNNTTTIYQYEYRYIGVNPNPSLEAYFSKILSSIQIK
jgi:hypothetical protein